MRVADRPATPTWRRWRGWPRGRRERGRAAPARGAPRAPAGRAADADAARHGAGQFITIHYHEQRMPTPLATAQEAVAKSVDAPAKSVPQAEPEQVHPQESADQVMVRITQDVPDRLIANHDSFLEISLDVGILFLVGFY